MSCRAVKPLSDIFRDEFMNAVLMVDVEKLHFVGEAHIKAQFRHQTFHEPNLIQLNLDYPDFLIIWTFFLVLFFFS